MDYSYAPAYTAVSARRTFEHQPLLVSHSHPPQSVPPPQPKKVNWPQPVRDYVQRSFAPEAMIPGIDRAPMEAKLKEIITQAAESNSLDTIDWDSLPLPQHYIHQEQREAAAARTLEARTLEARTLEARTLETPNGHLKRKPEDFDKTDSGDGDTPPWRKAAKTNAFEGRISYASKSQADKIDKRIRKRQEELRSSNQSKYNADLEKRKQRFGNASLHHSYQDDDVGGSSGPVVGTSQSIEKRYLRLTAPPKPETVRPLPVLEKTLDFLKKKWRQENDYAYICDQFKSLRQDLTVQHIKSEFTVNVYEIHARIALEKGDLGEFNQCQTQLRALYRESLGGHPAEFVAYRILYFIHTCNRADMNDVLTDLTVTDKQQPAVKHALEVRSALALGNYHKFFRLYLDTPNMGAYLMDMFVGRERLAALSNICKAYKPNIKIRFLTEELGFESDHDCVQFLYAYSAEEAVEEANGIYTLATAKAQAIFGAARAAAFRKVDIKGQI